MANLLITIMAVALAAFVLTMGAWYLDSRVGPTNEIKLKAMAGMVSLASGYRSFNMSDTQVLPESGWETKIGAYATVPQPPVKGLEWRYNCGVDWDNDTEACSARAGFCLRSTGDGTEVQFLGMKRARTQMSTSQVDIGSDCGKNEYNSADPASSSPVAMTYWLTN